MTKDIVFCDVDGTLVDCTRNLFEISEKTSYALKELKNKAYVFLVTGRPKCIIPKRVLECEPDGYILSNGTYCELNNEILYHNPVQELDKFREYCNRTGNTYMFMNQDYCFVKDTQNKISKDFITSMSYPPEQILREDRNIENSDFVWIHSETEEERLDFEKTFGDDYNLNRQQEKTFDLVKKGVSKGNTIKYFLEKTSIAYGKTYCFGDGLNDIGMMKLADVSICMENGREQTKKVATIITDDVLDNGFYNALVKLELIKPMK